MAGRYEKNVTRLSRWYLSKKEEEEAAKGKKKAEERPPLASLRTGAEVKHWIPSIKKEINWLLHQLSGVRNYPESKIKQFENRLENLRKEHERFVQRVYQLDPVEKKLGIKPGEAHAYVSKKRRIECERNIESDDGRCVLPWSNKQELHAPPAIAAVSNGCTSAEIHQRCTDNVATVMSTPQLYGQAPATSESALRFSACSGGSGNELRSVFEYQRAGTVPSVCDYNSGLESVASRDDVHRRGPLDICTEVKAVGKSERTEEERLSRSSGTTASLPLHAARTASLHIDFPLAEDRPLDFRDRTEIGRDPVWGRERWGLGHDRRGLVSDKLVKMASSCAQGGENDSVTDDSLVREQAASFSARAAVEHESEAKIILNPTVPSGKLGLVADYGSSSDSEDVS